MLVIKREKADMVVISTHGLSGWRPLILGSIAEKVIKLVDCTLLLLQSGHQVSAAEEPAIEVSEDTFGQRGIETKHVGSIVSGQEALAQKRLDLSAGDLAERAGGTEQHYDQTHSLFTQ
jgi:Universal stress protein family